MIDYGRFWAEAGCLPGMTRLQTENYLKSQLGAPASGSGFEARMPHHTPGPGATSAQVEEWERRRAVRLPEVLRLALGRQNGGYVRGTQFRILPLAEIGPIVDKEFWEFASYDEKEVADRQFVFLFAEDDESSGSFYLNFGRAPSEEPSVLSYHSDPGDLDRCSTSVSEFFKRMMHEDDIASVDWSETQSLPPVAAETIDLSRLYGQPAEKEQVLVRQGEVLVFFVREKTPFEERFTRTLLPLPLEAAMAWVQPWRPDPIRTYSLTLQPQDSEGIVELEAKQTENGRWKNSKSRGVPVLVQFESVEKSRLETLRREVLGNEAAGRSESEDQRREKFEEMMGSVPSGEQFAAGMQMFLQMMGPGGQSRPEAPQPESLPAEAAALQELLQQKLKGAMERAQQVLGEHPLSPETLRLLENARREGLGRKDEP
jgi:hypothetical protein